MNTPNFRELSIDDTEKIFCACKGNVAEYFYNFESIEEAEEWVQKAINEQKIGKKMSMLFLMEMILLA